MSKCSICKKKLSTQDVPYTFMKEFRCNKCHNEYIKQLDFRKIRLTRGEAVRQKCLDCMNYQMAEVAKCDIYGCPLWRYRLGSEKRSTVVKC